MLDTISTQPEALDLPASLDAMHLAQSLDRADLAAIVAQTERRTRARLGSSLAADAAQADALNRAIRNRANGLDLPHAINCAVRDAVRDAADRAARDSLASLDSTDADGRSLADRLDTGTSAARLSNYDEQSGVWRGVSRVAHPTDCLRPEMPSPEHLADMARDHIDANRLALLDACVAVNIAAQEQHRATLDAMTAYLRQTTTDEAAAVRACRSAAPIVTERKVTEKARRNLRSRPPVPGPRPVETVRAIACAADDYTPPGRAVANASRDLAETGETYWTHRHALAAAVLQLHADRLDREAETARRNATAYAVIVSGWTRGQETAPQTLQRIAAARLDLRRQRHAADQPRRRQRPVSTRHLPQPQPTTRTYVGRYAADNGQTQQPTRPMVRLPFWTESYGLRRRLSAVYSPDQASDHHKRADTIPCPPVRIPRIGSSPWSDGTDCHACTPSGLPMTATRIPGPSLPQPQPRPITAPPFTPQPPIVLCACHYRPGDRPDCPHHAPTA